MLHDLHVLSDLVVLSFCPVSINKVCEEVRNLVSAILYFLSNTISRYFSTSKLCIKIEYACKRGELFMFPYHDCL